MNNNATVHLSGGCYCGAISYEVTEAPLKTGVCYCRDCQHLSGGSSWPFVVVPSNALIVTGNLIEFKRVGSSGKDVYAGFCDQCSTTLFGRPDVWPHIRTVSASTLHHYKDFIPEMHAWVKEAPAWVVLSNDQPQFAENPA